MGWQTINQILGEAAINPDFCRELLASPVQTIEANGWHLAEEERQVLETIHAQSLTEFSQLLLSRLPRGHE